MRKKWILLPLVLILVIIMSIGMFYHNKLVDVSKLIEKENTEDLILTIYYMYPDVLTEIPISIDIGNLLSTDKCCVRQYRNFGIRIETVSQLKRNIHYLGKIRIHGRLAVTGKSNRINRYSFLRCLGELVFKSCSNLGKSRKDFVTYPVFVPSALTIYTVEVAQLAFRRKNIHSKRRTKSATEYRAENYIIEMKHIR